MLGSGADRGRGVLPAVRTLLEEHGVAPRDLAGIVVDVGPGSFTGVRVGVTTAKTLGFALEVPIVAVTSLEALAATVASRAPVLALRDAGRGRLYAAAWAAGEPGQRPVVLAPTREAAPSLLRRLGPDAGMLAVGEGAPALLAGTPWPVEERAAGAEAVLAVGEPRLARGETTPPHTLAPRYLQASAPERRLAGEADGDASAGVRTDRP